VAYIWDTRLMTVVYSRKSSQCSWCMQCCCIGE
jgi:hypothetical protein